jgi:hypothetical protein
VFDGTDADANQEPKHLAELLVHKLTVEAVKHVQRSGWSRRELARRLDTSVPQLYRFLDPTNTRKSLSQLVSLLQVLDCVVDLVELTRSIDTSRDFGGARGRAHRGRSMTRAAGHGRPMADRSSTQAREKPPPHARSR